MRAPEDERLARARAEGVRQGVQAIRAEVEAACRKIEARTPPAGHDATGRAYLEGRRAQAKALREAVNDVAAALVTERRR